MGENSLNTRSAPPATKSWNDFICASTREGNFTKGSRNFPKYFCGRTDLSFAITINCPCGVIGRRIKKLFSKKGFPAPKPFTKSATATQSASSKCRGILSPRGQHSTLTDTFGRCLSAISGGLTSQVLDFNPHQDH